MIFAIILALISIVALFEFTTGEEPLLAYIVLLYAVPSLIVVLFLLAIF